jgi:hypothetical protein
VPAAAAAVVLDQVDLQRAGAGLVPGEATDRHGRLQEPLRVRRHRQPARLGARQLRDAARHRRAADAPQLLEHLGGRLELTAAHQIPRDARQVRLQALGAAVIQRLPHALDRAQAGQVLARPAAPHPGRPWRRSRHRANGVLPVPAQHPLELVEQRALRGATHRPRYRSRITCTYSRPAATVRLRSLDATTDLR